MKKNKLVIKFISVLLALATLVLFTTACSSDPVDKIWYDYETGSDANQSNTYPYNQVNIEYSAIRSIGFDLIYGVRRSLVRYRGETPFYYTHDSEGVAHPGFENLPYTPSILGRRLSSGTIPTDSNGNEFDTSYAQYWGSGVALTNDSPDIEELENVNLGDDGSIKSLRLYAWKLSSSSGWFANAGYNVFKWFAWLGSLLARLVIMIKNINIFTIMSALNLSNNDPSNPGLLQIINDIFIGERDPVTGQLTKISPFAVMSLLAFVISIVGFAINYFRGGKKSKDLWKDILLIAIAGLLIIGFALNGGGFTLGNTIAHLSTRLAQEIQFGNPQDEMWKTTTTSYGQYTADVTQDTMYTEISLVNRSLIDSQICAQFGVKQISELNFETLGDDAAHTYAKKYLTTYYLSDNKINATDNQSYLLSRLGNNLGYYFWYANSPYKVYTSNYNSPSVIFATNLAQTDKLDRIITYLQVLYDNNATDNVRREKILNIMEHFARPSPGSMIVQMILLIVVYVLLTICLFKYAIKIVLAKFSLLLGAVALPISGILMCTTNKNLVKTGKGLFGIFIMAFIRITVFSIFFDLIIYTAGMLISTDLIRLLIVGALLGIMWKFNPAIDKTVESALQTIERTISPESRDLKAQAKQYARRKIGDAKRRNIVRGEKHGKIIGYDAEGKPIRQGSKGGLFDTALSIADNALNTNDPSSKKSITKITRESSKDRQEEKATKQKSVTNVAQETREKNYRAAKDAVKDRRERIQTDINDETNRAYHVNDYGTTVFIRDNLTASEKIDSDNINNKRAKLEEVKNKLAILEQRQINNNDLSAEEQEELSTLNTQAGTLKTEIDEGVQALRSNIDKRIRLSVTQTHSDELRQALERKQRAIQMQINKDSNVSSTKFEEAAQVEKELEILNRVDYGDCDADATREIRLTEDEISTAAQLHEIHLTQNYLQNHGTKHNQIKQARKYYRANFEETLRLHRHATLGKYVSTRDLDRRDATRQRINEERRQIDAELLERRLEKRDKRETKRKQKEAARDEKKEERRQNRRQRRERADEYIDFDWGDSTPDIDESIDISTDREESISNDVSADELDSSSTPEIDVFDDDSDNFPDTSTTISREELEDRSPGMMTEIPPKKIKFNSSKRSNLDEETERLIDIAVKELEERGEISVSRIQRMGRVGYKRAESILDELEHRGYVSHETTTSSTGVPVKKRIVKDSSPKISYDSSSDET